MHSDEIKKAVFPKDVAMDELYKKNQELNNLVRELQRKANYYTHLRDIGVVLTTDEGAKYLQGEDMDTYLAVRYVSMDNGFGMADVKQEWKKIVYVHENTK